MEVADGIHRLPAGVANFYVIRESGKLVLVDAGTPKDWNLFSRTVATLGARLEDLDAVLLTHAHADHTGFAEQAHGHRGPRYTCTSPTQRWPGPGRTSLATGR
jgi:glyoxylase-like metal-dependent hydrolase (beta-lactamase superfamily II)